MGGVEKGGGWKTSRMTPLPKRGFGPPLVRYVFHPPQASAFCFSCTKIHDRADQKLFWRGPKIFGRTRSLVRFPPPIRFAPPHITAQSKESVLKVPKWGQFHTAIRVTRKRCDSCAQVALGTRTVSRRNFWDAESLAKRYVETCYMLLRSLRGVLDVIWYLWAENAWGHCDC